MTEYSIFFFVALVLGLALGSFCGSASYRIAHDWSLFTPSGSHCPGCGKGLSWKENIPLLSFIIQRGRCQGCKAKLSWLYPIAESSFACWSVMLFVQYGMSVEYAVFMCIGMILLLISLVDLEAYFIPDLLVTVGALLAGSASFMGIGIDIVDALLAAILGTAVLQCLRLGYQWLRKKEGMGFGDVKLMFLLGLCCGVMGLPYVLLLSALLALIITLVLHSRDAHSQTRLPFGPYLCTACALYMLFQDSIIKFFTFGG